MHQSAGKKTNQPATCPQCGRPINVSTVLARRPLPLGVCPKASAAARDAVFTDRPEYRRRVRGIIPLDIQTCIWARCWAIDRSFRQTLKDCSAPVTEAVSTDIVESLRHNPALMSELRFWMSTMDVASKNAQASIANTEQLRESIDAVLANSR